MVPQGQYFLISPLEQILEQKHSALVKFLRFDIWLRQTWLKSEMKYKTSWTTHSLSWNRNNRKSSFSPPKVMFYGALFLWVSCIKTIEIYILAPHKNNQESNLIYILTPHKNNQELNLIYISIPSSLSPGPSSNPCSNVTLMLPHSSDRSKKKSTRPLCWSTIPKIIQPNNKQIKIAGKIK